MIIGAAEKSSVPLASGDLVVIAQKIVSKADNRYVRLTDVTPTQEAVSLARKTDKDARVVELILRESTEVLRYRPGAIIVAHRLGIVLANAGIDQSNIDHAEGERVLLLPEDPDRSAADLRRRFAEHADIDVAVLINDSVGRAWRNGTVGIALGAAGLAAYADLRGEDDLFGRKLMVTEVGWADELASAASFLMGQGDEGTPVVIVRGELPRKPETPAAALIRPKNEDLFR